MPEWEVTRRMPSGALLRAACPPTALPHQRPAKGNSKKIPTCQNYRRLQPSVPHHLINLLPTPSHRVVWLQPRFPRDAYVGLVHENMSYDVNTPSDGFGDDLFLTNLTWDRTGQRHFWRVKTPSPATNHQDPTTIGAFHPFILP